jgi:hypothetical protein
MVNTFALQEAQKAFQITMNGCKDAEFMTTASRILDIKIGSTKDTDYLIVQVKSNMKECPVIEQQL